MKKLSALLLSLLLLLTACGTPATPGDAATLPTPNDEILVEEGLRAEDLPEVCRLWFDLAETSGAADKNSKLPLASRADEGACDYLAVRLPDGTYTDLIQEGKLADEGVTLADFSGGRAKQEGSYGQLAWNGELYHAFTVSAADCTLPNLTAPDGGILRLNISGDCTVDGGGTEYACFEGFDCVLVTGGGTLTVLNAAALDCGGGDLPIPSLVLDGDVTLRCDDIRLTAPNTVDVPALAVLGGTLCTDMLWLSNGMLVNAGGTLSVQGSVQELKRAVFRGGTAPSRRRNSSSPAARRTLRTVLPRARPSRAARAFFPHRAFPARRSTTMAPSCGMARMAPSIAAFMARAITRRTTARIGRARSPARCGMR